ncbi:HAD-IIIC family phosphatase [Flavobacteriaceae bacterium]|nr:HAD-IIIC family phosphatase [Flavobacteriaceae bacterium]
MNHFIFRNTTLEPLFRSHNVEFSGYDDISYINNTADIFSWFYVLPFQQNNEILVDQIAFFNQNIEMVYSQIPDTKYFCVFTLFNPFTSPIKTGNLSLMNAINEFNQNIIKFSKSRNNFKIINTSDFILNNQKVDLIDWKYYFISKMLINPKLSMSFGSWFKSQIDAILLKRKKCLVLDLDNTLWGGILGEDGVTGIKIGGDYPGNAFTEFQKSIINLKNSGIILSICSKNNESDVLEAWDKNPNIIIKKSDISSYRINWNNKADNIREIADELNIGLDSMVFIDDNPTERELVKQILPDVTTPDFPIHPHDLVSFSTKLVSDYFQVYNITEEDLNKTKQYKSNTERSVFKKSFDDFNQYLLSLEITILIEKASPLSISRIAQMTQKTNQFNLTTYRYTEGDIKEFVKNDDWVFTIDIKDKFGDNGITGLMIIELDNTTARINSFLLSCRVLGKGIELAFISHLLFKLKESGIKKVCAQYIPTPKNSQVKDFYEKVGFKSISLEDDNLSTVRDFIIILEDFQYKKSDIYNIEEK